MNLSRKALAIACISALCVSLVSCGGGSGSPAPQGDLGSGGTQQPSAIPTGIDSLADDYFPGFTNALWLASGVTYGSDTGSEVTINGVSGIAGVVFQCVHYVKNVLYSLPTNDVRRNLSTLRWGSGGTTQTDARVQLAENEGLRVDQIPRKGSVFLMQTGTSVSHTGVVTDSYLNRRSDGVLQTVAVIKHANIDDGGTVYHDDIIATEWPSDVAALRSRTFPTAAVSAIRSSGGVSRVRTLHSSVFYVHLQETLESQKDDAARGLISQWYNAGKLKAYRGQDPATGAPVPSTEYIGSAAMLAVVRMARTSAERDKLTSVVSTFRDTMGRPIDVGSFLLYAPAHLAGDSIATVVAQIKSTPEYLNKNAATCAGTWSAGTYQVGAVENRILSCSSGLTGSISQSQQCIAANTWGTISEVNSCTRSIAPPRNVKASSKPDGVHVAWSASDGADGYVVWREVSPNQPSPYSQTSAASFVDTQVTSGNQYCYYISAFTRTNSGGSETSHPFYDCAFRQ